jgi:hypothetical protein
MGQVCEIRFGKDMKVIYHHIQREAALSLKPILMLALILAIVI